MKKWSSTLNFIIIKHAGRNDDENKCIRNVDYDNIHSLKESLWTWLSSGSVLRAGYTVVNLANRHIPAKWSEVAQSWPTLCDPTDCSLPGSSVHGIFQARVLEWIAISFSRGSSRPRDRTRVYPHCRQRLYRLSPQGSLKWASCACTHAEVL